MKRLLYLASAFLLLASFASAQDVSYNFDQKADFTKFKTYKWVAIKDGEQLDELTAKMVVQAIETQLTAKGLKKVESGDANLLVAYQVAITKEKQVTSLSTGYGMGPGWGGRYYGGYYGAYGGGTSTTTSATIFMGSLALDMYDSAAKTLAWRGLASKQIDTKASPEKRQKNLDKGMAKLLKNYPPPVKKK
jgi:hypothetical protein